MLSPSPHTTTLLFPLVCAPVLCQAANGRPIVLGVDDSSKVYQGPQRWLRDFCDDLKAGADRRNSFRSEGPSHRIRGQSDGRAKRRPPRVRWLALSGYSHPSRRDQKHLAQGCESDELPWE